MILYKYPEKQREISKLPSVLQQMIEVYDFLALKITGNPYVVITEIYRPKKHENDLHGLYRAVDIAILEKGGLNSSERMREIMNTIYTYDPKRPRMQCVVPLDHGNAPHTHMQVHANTTSMNMHYWLEARGLN